MPLNKRKIAAFDVETGGDLPEYALQPYRLTRGQAWLNSSAAARFDGVNNSIDRRSIKQPTVEDHRQMLVWAAEHGITLVGWNMSFDVAWLVAQGLGDEVSQCRFLDVMLLWQHLEREPEYEIPGAKKRPWTLKQAVREHWPKLAGYEAGVVYSPQTEKEWRDLLKYNELDAVFTLMLAVKFYNRLEKQSERQLRNALIEAGAIGPVAQSIVQGLQVDASAANRLQTSLDEEIDTIKTELAVTGVTEQIIASPKQLQRLLYDEWQLPVVWRTPKGAPSTDKTALYLLAEHDARVSRIKQLREHKLNRTKFCEKVKASVAYNEDGRTRPAMRIYGTYTGRATFASKQGQGKAERQTGFAIHQMKNGPEYRGLITVPEGYTLVEWDASGQEYRWMAVESGDSTMLSLCEPGEDPHSYMGAGIIHEDYRWVASHKDSDPVAKQGRKMGKMGNLSCQFRIGYKKLHTQAHVQFGIPISLTEADHVHRTYHATYPGVKDYWKRKIAEARRKGYAETIAGRRVLLNGSWTDRSVGWKLESTAVNFPIQGIGADQKYLAIKVIQPWLRKYGGYFYFELHDGLYAILPNKVAMKAGLKIRDVLSNLPYKQAWNFTPPVPMPFDMKIGKDWGSLREIE